MIHDDAFLTAILADPEDDTLRLIFADALEERGDARGEFIRVQVELAGTPEMLPKGTVIYNQGQAVGILLDGKTPNPRHLTLRGREQELFGQVGANPFAWFPGIATVTIDPAKLIAEPLVVPSGLLRRGFIEAVALPPGVWLDHADALLKAAPIREVKLVTWPSPGEEAKLLAQLPSHYSYPTKIGELLSTVYLRWLAAVWPRVQFTLPPYGPFPRRLPLDDGGWDTSPLRGAARTSVDGGRHRASFGGVDLGEVGEVEIDTP